MLSGRETEGTGDLGDWEFEVLCKYFGVTGTAEELDDVDGCV
jgi:hypothetical protein